MFHRVVCTSVISKCVNPERKKKVGFVQVVLLHLPRAFKWENMDRKKKKKKKKYAAPNILHTTDNFFKK